MLNTPRAFSVVSTFPTSLERLVEGLVISMVDLLTPALVCRSEPLISVEYPCYDEVILPFTTVSRIPAIPPVLTLISVTFSVINASATLDGFTFVNAS